MQASKLILASAALLALVAACQMPEDKQSQGKTKSSSTADQEVEVILTWDKSLDDSVMSYKIYVASTEGDTGSLLKTVDATSTDFDTDEPKTRLNSQVDTTLGEFKSGRACFAISSLDLEEHESSRTAPVCTNL